MELLGFLQIGAFVVVVLAGVNFIYQLLRR